VKAAQAKHSALFTFDDGAHELDNNRLHSIRLHSNDECLEEGGIMPSKTHLTPAVWGQQLHTNGTYQDLHVSLPQDEELPDDFLPPLKT
jgi:hypothetical protein